ncbi:MAG: hypothetical protein SGJ24_04770 [Chloroflexota bacterium]|nr:hypothetical protein [Chloroflexota bacterium]
MIDDTYFFSAHDHALLASSNVGCDSVACPELYSLSDRMGGLQRIIGRRIFASGSDIKPCWNRPAVSAQSFASATPIAGLTFAFVRPQGEAMTIERMMGRGTEVIAQDSSRHPILEVRLTPTNVVIELIVSPQARWDQRNLSGKLRIERHRAALRTLLCEGRGALRLGFWHGEELHDTHLTCGQLVRGDVLGDWFGTFAAEHEWLRIGFWLEAGHRSLMHDQIRNELSARAVLLSKILQFFAWSNDNNFHHFYSTGIGKQTATHMMA